MITGTSTIALTDVIVKDRIRADLGDIEELAESIAREGLLQPIVIDDQNRLVAGGRRYTAFTLLNSNKVACENPALYAQVPYVRLGQLSPSRKVMLELEENWRRKAMTWQENVIGISMYHKAAVSNARADGDSWSQQLTGKLLGMNQAKVSVALTIAKHIKRAPTGPIAKAENLTQAVELLAKLTLDTATAERAARFKAKQAVAPSPTSCSVPSNSASDTSCLPNTSGAVAPIYRPSIISQLSDELGSALTTTAGAKSPLVPKEALANFYTHVGDCIDYLSNYAASGKVKFNHIITDPPYGIDLDTDYSKMGATTTKYEKIKGDDKEFDLTDVISISGTKEQYIWGGDYFVNSLDWMSGTQIIWAKRHSEEENKVFGSAFESLWVSYKCKKLIWFIRPINQSSERLGKHPTQKPIECMSRCIEMSKLKGGVYDAFLGSGSTMVASHQLKRKCYGMELDPKYCQVIVDRMRKLDPNLTIKRNGVTI